MGLVAPGPTGVLRSRPRHGLSPSAPGCSEGGFLFSCSGHAHIQACCGVDVMPYPACQMPCPTYCLTLDRDTDVANNMANCVWDYAEDGDRPRGLERPVQAARFAYMAEDDAFCHSWGLVPLESWYSLSFVRGRPSSPIVIWDECALGIHSSVVFRATCPFG